MSESKYMRIVTPDQSVAVHRNKGAFSVCEHPTKVGFWTLKYSTTHMKNSNSEEAWGIITAKSRQTLQETMRTLSTRCLQGTSMIILDNEGEIING